MVPGDLVTSLASSTYLLLRSERTSANPVALLFGRERLATSPIPTGLPTLTNRIGIVDVWRFTATDAVEPAGTSSPVPRCINPVTAREASGSLLIHTTSSTTSRPSTTPASRSPCRNASTRDLSYVLEGEPRGRNPTRTGALSCASAA